MSLARYMIIIISPLSRQDRNGDMLVYLCPLSVCVAFCLSVCPAVSETVQAEAAEVAPANTIRWPNAGLMLTHRRQRWANISPILGYRVMFGATLNVGQRHKQQANSNTALDQSIVPVRPAWSTD